MKISAEVTRDEGIASLGVEVAVFNRHDLEDGQVKVTFAAKFPVENLAA